MRLNTVYFSESTLLEFLDLYVTFFTLMPKEILEKTSCLPSLENSAKFCDNPLKFHFFSN